MKRNIRKGLLAAFISAITLCSGAIVVTSGANATVQDGWSEISLQENYLQGETVSVPNRTFALDGNVLNADAVITYPDGTTTRNTQVKLNMAGRYTVDYTAVVAGVVYKETETFVVDYKTVSFEDENTSAQYGAHDLAPDVNGLVVRLAQKDVLLFNDVIDLSAATLDKTIFEAFVTADSPGNLDFKKLYVQFTDVEDPNSYFKARFIHTMSSSGGPFSYVLAGASDQLMTGVESSSGEIHVEGNWGALVRHSFLSKYGTSTSETGKTRLTLRYDAESKELYSGTEFVIDFDSPNYFTNLWNGFTSGKVQMSVWAEDYSSSSANFVITKAGDIDLSREVMPETTPPEIRVDTDYAADAMPVAKVGSEYPIPSASAHDLYSGDCKVTTQVFYNYTSQPSLTKITDGKFKAEYVGKYAIVYTASDRMGNVAKEVLWVDVVDELGAPAISIEGDIPAEVLAGDKFVLPAYEVTGGSGESDVKIFAHDGTMETEITDTYLFNAVGEHTFRIVATDYIGQTTEKQFKITALAGERPVFLDAPVLPEYFIAGAYYVLPDLYANDYTSGSLVRKLASVKVEDASGERSIASGESFIPTVENNFDCVQIIYEIDGVAYSTEIPTVMAKNENGIYIANYFHMQGATIELGDTSSVIAVTAPAQENAGWRFANSLISEDVSVAFSAIPESSKYDGLKVTFTDSVDASISVSAYVYKNAKEASITVGETQFYDSTFGFERDSKSKDFTVGYADGSVFVNNASVVVDTTENGEAFNGFPSNKVYVAVEFVNARENAAYTVVAVNGQLITTSTMDNVAPKIVVLGTSGGTMPIDSKVVLPSALAGDTLDPNVTFTLRVLSPSGKVVVSTDNVTLDEVDPMREYEIELTEYGQYRIQYTAKDSFNGRPTTRGSYTINVNDTYGPEITLDGAYKTELKVGETISVPKYSVQDNVDTVEELVIVHFCRTPSGEVMTFKDGYVIEATQAGVYQIRIFAMDTFGNVTLYTIDVEVKE